MKTAYLPIISGKNPALPLTNEGMLISGQATMVASVIVGRGATATSLKIYDGLDDKGDLKLDIDATTPRQWNLYEMGLTSGLYVVFNGLLSAAPTVFYET